MRFGSRQFQRAGRIIHLEEIPEKSYAHFSDFREGYDSSDTAQDTPDNASPYMLDVEVTVHDTLRRAPGVMEVETIEDREPYAQLILHASLDNRSELLLIDPPYLGIKTTGDTNWIDGGLIAGGRYAYTNFGGSLIFSNGISKVFVRQSETETVEELTTAPVARSYATFAGRVWAGGAQIDGRYEPLGVAWSSAFSDYEDWTGVGSGFELLIANVMIGDRIVSLRPMGLDFMAILCRRSVWIGRRTGLRDRPADFMPRVPGVGAVSDSTNVVTRFGVIFLSDSGVFLFDGNNAELISKKINKELLPIDFSALHLYSASYNPFSKRYYLHTPTDTWVYDLDYDRWYRRSLISRASSVFANQFDAITWAELIGSWDDQNRTWASYSPEEGDTFQHFFLAQNSGVWQLGVEDKYLPSNFGADLQAVWETKTDQSSMPTDQIFTDDVLLNYRGGGSVTVGLPNIMGHFHDLTTLALPTQNVPVTSRSRTVHSGNGVGVRVRLVDGDVEIGRISVGFRVTSPRIEIPPLETVELPHEEEPIEPPPVQEPEPEPDEPWTPPPPPPVYEPPPPVDSEGELVVFPTAEIEFITGQQLVSGSHLNPWPWFDTNAIDSGILRGDGFFANPSLRSYYDQTLCQYINYYRTGNEQFLQYAREQADYRYSVLEPNGTNIAPRSVAMGGLMLRAMDGRPDMWPWITAWVNHHLWNWIERRYANTDLWYGVRDGAYCSLYATQLSVIHPDPAVRADLVTRSTKAVMDYWKKHQDRWNDGGWYWKIKDADSTLVEQPAYASQPFMVGILMEALIAHHQTTGNVAAVQMISDGASWLFDKGYEKHEIGNMPGYYWRAMKYFVYQEDHTVNDRTSALRYNKTDGAIRDVRQLNSTTAHAFGYAYKITGNPAHLSNGDDVFSSSYGKFSLGPGTDGYWCLADYDAKSYNQCYRAGGRYLVTRLG
jgi:hypothetical protein